LFGDGAGAVVMELQQQPGTREDRGVLTSHLRSDGRHVGKLYADGGVSTTGTAGVVKMEGRAVFKHAVAMIADVIDAAFKATGYTAADIDWFVPHQANKRIIDDSAHKLGIDPPGPLCRRQRRPNPAGEPHFVRGHGRRLHLGLGPGALVARLTALTNANILDISVAYNRR
jgi:3-oxoacyl-[acyl-carrier-protein] synthase III